MEKKEYLTPMMEVTMVNLATGVLGVTSTDPFSPAPGRKELF